MFIVAHELAQLAKFSHPLVWLDNPSDSIVPPLLKDVTIIEMNKEVFYLVKERRRNPNRSSPLLDVPTCLPLPFYSVYNTTSPLLVL